MSFVLGYLSFLILFSFFIQEEDGIRSHCVTGVQPCALPISRYTTPAARSVGATAARTRPARRSASPSTVSPPKTARSEERRVGKERRYQGVQIRIRKHRGDR